MVTSNFVRGYANYEGFLGGDHKILTQSREGAETQGQKTEFSTQRLKGGVVRVRFLDRAKSCLLFIGANCR